MSVFNSRSTGADSSVNKKKRLTQDQVMLLEASFNCHKKLDHEQKLQLALQLGIPPRQISIWYQNKRVRWKNQSLELDFSALQLKLDTTLSEKRQLEKEIEKLRGELHKAKDALLVCKQPHPLAVSSLSSGGDGDGDGDAGCCGCGCGRGCGGSTSTSSLQDDDIISCCWENGSHHEAMQLDELYACLMGAEGSSNRNLSISIPNPQIGKFSFFKL